MASAFVVDYVKPNSGSLAGGQLVSVHGRGLLPQSSDLLVPATVITIGGVPCDIQRVMSTDRRVVCETRPYWSFSGLDSVANLCADAP